MCIILRTQKRQITAPCVNAQNVIMSCAELFCVRPQKLQNKKT